MSDELKPCPFCGGEACVIEISYHRFRVICVEKGCCRLPRHTGQFCTSYQSAVDIWNFRSAESDLAEALERLHRVASVELGKSRPDVLDQAAAALKKAGVI